MSLLGKMQSHADMGEATQSDSMGVLKSALYEMIIKAAFITKSTGGALGLNLHTETKDGRTMKSVIYISNKAGENFYVKDGKKNYLPGFLQANALYQLAAQTVDRELSGAVVEQATIKLYNKDLQKEVPTQVDMLTELVGQPIKAGVLQVREEKMNKDHEGRYTVPTGEFFNKNEFDRFFSAGNNKTISEVKEGKDAETYVKWNDKWAGEVKVKGSTGGANAPKAGAPTAGAGNQAASQPAGAAETKSLFG